MSFNFKDNTKKITEIYQLLEKNHLIVDHSYQRKAIWSDADKCRLIETILLNYVVPSVYWWQSEIDPNTGSPLIHIVDGQQRITSIYEFLEGKFKLNKNYLLEEESKKLYGDKTFRELSDGEKGRIWNYEISIIEIDKNAKEKDITNMFRRLNLTEYTLNAQEKRHSEKGCFHEFATEVADNNFWDEVKLFNATDIKRMQDVTYSANIIILMKKGIVDQSKIDLPINEFYEKYKDEYPEKELFQDKLTLERAFSIFSEFYNNADPKNRRFYSRKVQNYSVFSLIFFMIRREVELSRSIMYKMNNFLIIYNHFKNENSDELDLTENEKQLFDSFRKYKLASSEGVNKINNRMIRFNTLKDLIINNDVLENDDLVTCLVNKIRNG